MSTPTQPTLTPLRIASFRRRVWNFYKKNKRPFVWRETTDPYAIVVSEIMLQQTQTDRVAKKFPEFLKTFPTFKTLAASPLAEVLRAWQGLGYNRRAIALQKISARVMHEFKGKLPNNPEMLQTFPGIGPNTAGSVCAFAFNEPTVFIETNIRTVLLHHFFPQQEKVHDRELIPLIEQTLNRKNPREWYYALMDYGVHLKKLHKNPSRRSLHHAKQSKFEGSDRQLRGALLRFFLKKTTATLTDLHKAFQDYEPERLERIVHSLMQEHFVQEQTGFFTLT